MVADSGQSLHYLFKCGHRVTYFGKTWQFHSQKKCTKYLWLVYWYCRAVDKLQNDTEICCNKLQLQEEIIWPWPSNTCLYHYFTLFNNNGPSDSTSFLSDPLMGCWGKWRLTLTVPDLHSYTGPLDLPCVLCSKALLEPYICEWDARLRFERW